VGAKTASKWRRQLADIFELPREIILDLPRVTITGNLQCHIENHGGIIAYTGGKVRIALTEGELAVSGENLVIRYMNKDEIAIDGSILGIQYKPA
jgi:sporulation protein YqfC